MTLEVAVKVTLVGETELAYKFLKALVGVHERYLEFYDCVVVDYLLCVLSARALAYGIEVAGRNLEHVGIVLY